MTPRAKLLIASFVAIPCLAWTCPCFGHNGRDADPVDFEDLREAVASVTEAGKFRPTDIFSGITISTDPRTGVRTYTQTGEVPANPARASRSAVTGPGAHGVDFWVEQSFAETANNGGNAPSPMYQAEPSVSSYDESYSDYGYGYGSYYPVLGDIGGGGRGGHRPGHGGGGGRPGRPGGGDDKPRTNGGYNLQPHSRYSPPPGPLGGGVGSPPPYPFGGVGAPAPVLRYNSFGGRRR